MNLNSTSKQPEPTTAQTKKPNESGTISVEGFVRIFDPKSKEVYVEKRA